MKKRDNILRLKYRLTTILIMMIIFGCTKQNDRPKGPRYTISYSAGDRYCADYTNSYVLDRGCVHYNSKTKCGDFEIESNW
jgi:hypothetical protein